MRAIVTTSRKYSRRNGEIAEETAKRLNLPQVERGRESVTELKEKYDADFVLVARKNTLYLCGGEQGDIFFHPGMAHLRLKNLREGKGDRMTEAMDLTEGANVLDCTLGMGADAIVAASVTKVKVTALEINPLLAELMRFSLKNFPAENEKLKTAMENIEVITADYRDFLSVQDDNSFDVVYFDPMFRHPFTDSAAINPLRAAACSAPLSPFALAAAKRVAKERVVLKETSKSREFARLGFGETAGGKYSKIRYGIIRTHS